MNLKEHTKYLNKENTIAVLFLNDIRFDPNSFCGEKFTRVKEETYVEHDGDLVIENPKSKGTCYGKDLIVKAKSILELFGYSGLKIWIPACDSYMIITYDEDTQVLIVAPRVKNF